MRISIYVEIATFVYAEITKFEYVHVCMCRLLRNLYIVTARIDGHTKGIARILEAIEYGLTRVKGT